MRSGTLLLLFVIFSSYAAFGQNPNPNIATQIPYTKLELFAAKPGPLVVTETYRGPTISGLSCNVQLYAISLNEAGRETEKVRGLRVDVTETSPFRNTTAYIDREDIGNLNT